ncbi:MAG: spore germination protein [Prevotella sp.]|nr:spore germination protein [Staphylococcus sp.]MCM1349814.1 spore germination protein [Prevotella sp.]
MNDTLQTIQDKLSSQDAFDVTTRTIKTPYHQYDLVFLNFLCSHDAIVDIIYTLTASDQASTTPEDIAYRVLNESTTIETDGLAVYHAILNGHLAIICDTGQTIVSEVKQYPNRSIAEPDSEKVVRGSRDGFTENIATNIGLIRRRIKTGQLKILKYEIGKLSKTIVSLIYLEGSIQSKYIEDVKHRLASVEIEELTMGDKALEELMVNDSLTPYPLVKYTERPDTFCAHLYQGMFGILVDTSPCAMLGPISIFDHMQHAEEFRQSRVSGSYLRFIRFIGIVVSFLAVPIWYTLLEYKIELGGYFGNFFEVEFNKYAIFAQIILMELGVEFIRMASIHTPTALSTSMGIIAGIVIGEMAIDIGILSEQIVLLGAISAIGSYITPSYELSLANKMAKIFIIVAIFLFDIYGLIGGILLLLIYLCTRRSFGRPYLYPLLPFNLKDFSRQLFRSSYLKKNRHNRQK